MDSPPAQKSKRLFDALIEATHAIHTHRCSKQPCDDCPRLYQTYRRALDERNRHLKETFG